MLNIKSSTYMPKCIFTSLLFALLSVIIINIQKTRREPDNILVNISQGLVRGSLMKTFRGKDIYAFRGLNYAEPPIGPLRFKNPVRVKRWKGVFDASKEGPACVQSTGVNMSEDCLTLNIYTKQIQSSETENIRRSPVIVFIHPGAYTRGSSQSFVFGPLYLLDQDVVLVTINHRLSTLGFINTGDEYSSGNYGFKDQVLALEFLRDNIAAFGGNPNSVTLTGQSSGARSIVLHLVSPMSKGLFHKAIAMSGSSIVPIPPQKQQTSLAFKQARLLNCTTETRKDMFRCLRNKSAEKFGETVDSFKLWYMDPVLVWYPSIEPKNSGSFLSDRPEKLMRNEKINSIPLMIGYTKDENSYRVAKGIEESLKKGNKYFEELNERWPTLAPICFGYERNTDRSKQVSEQIRQYYFGNDEISSNNSDVLRKLYSHSLAQYPIYRTAMLVAKFSSNPVYFYEFSYKGRYSSYYWSGTNKPAGGVAHGDDLQYIFGKPNNVYHKFPTFSEDDPEFFMVDRLTNIWAHFAKTGEPLPKDHESFGNITWPKFTTENENYLNIGKEMTVEKDVLPKTKQFWDNLFSQHFEP